MSKPAEVIEGEVEAPKSRKVAKLVTHPPAPAEANSLIQMIERVLLQNPSIETIERLLSMQQAVVADQKKTRYLAGLSRLQAKLPAVARKGTGHNQKKYARFEDLVETIKEPMAEDHFSLTFRIDQREGLIEVTGILGHEDGHQEATRLALPADTSGNKNAVQAWGSSISYAKRYVAMTLLGIATEDEDDDGKAAGAADLITDVQAGKIKSLIVEAGADTERFAAYMKVERIEDIPAARFAHAVGMLNKKRNAHG